MTAAPTPIHRWELVWEDNNERTYRMRLPAGGWLYRFQDLKQGGTNAMAYVPPAEK